MSSGKSMSGRKDIFAQIAAQREQYRTTALVEPAPIKRPNITVEATRSDPRAAFTPAPKIDDRAKLERRLEAERKRMGKFMADLAPAIQDVRRVTPLTAFEYKLLKVGEAMEESALSAAPAVGWQTVWLPHYGGPLGRATAYYRTAFTLDETEMAGKACWVRFKGVDYNAHVFVNGTFLGSHEGFFAPFEFDFTRVARPGENVLLVRVENDAICMSNASWGEDGHLYEGDKIYAATGMGYDEPLVGWHHCPPGMGIYHEVSVEIRGRIHVADIFVRPFLAEKRAEVWIELESTCLTREDVTIEFSVFGQNFRQTVGKPQRRSVNAGPARNDYRFPIEIPNPRAWDLETPWLYQVQVRLLDRDGRLLDTARRQFGMRDFSLDTQCAPKGMFRLNDRRVRLRGANEMGYLQQCVAKKEFDKLRDAILLARICHMNFVRLTQRPVQDEIYQMCDKLGLMTQTDLPLFGVFRRSQFCEGVRQAEEMERLVRAHPCNIAVTYINEPFPQHGKEHRHLTSEELPAFFRACDEAVKLANPDRVIKPVDGDYDPPHEGLPDSHCYNCWYNGHGLPLGKLIKGYWQRVKPGWNYGCGEFGTEGLDPVETMYKYYPKDWLPRDRAEAWFPSRIVQAQTGRFHYMWFATQKTVEEWIAESQRHQARSTRLMTEAFRRDPRMVSIAIHLFIDAFPSGWMKAIMDVDANPKPAYFAYREALTPVAANIRTDRNTYFAGEKTDLEFWVPNDRDETLSGCDIAYQVRQKGKVIFAAGRPAVIAALAPNFQGRFRFQLPKVTERTVLSVELAVRNRNGRILHDTAAAIEVFPRRAVPKAEVFVLGRRTGSAWGLVEELGLRPRVWKKEKHGTILADSLDNVRQNRKALEAAMKAGARVVLTDVTVKTEEEFTIADVAVKLKEAGMGPRLFANCSTGHSLVSGFRKDDFFMWCNARTGLIEPILPASMTGDGLTAILLTGDGRWGMQEWTVALAAGCRSVGSGELVISLVQLLGRTKTNPVAREYALRLLGHA